MLLQCASSFVLVCTFDPRIVRGLPLPLLLQIDPPRVEEKRALSLNGDRKGEIELHREIFSLAGRGNRLCVVCRTNTDRRQPFENSIRRRGDDLSSSGFFHFRRTRLSFFRNFSNEFEGAKNKLCEEI